MPNKVKILAVGDIIGKGARNAFINYISTLKEKYNYDIIIINGENTSHGRGMNYKHYRRYNNNNVDVITMGNHVLDNKEIYNYIEKTNNLVVPGNIDYKTDVFDLHKQCVLDFKGYKIKVINLIGQMDDKFKLEIQNPLKYFDTLYQEDSQSIYIVDYHAEYTLEKNLFGYYVDGRASLVFGTHTHVQTADERLLPNKTAYISDVGMCGSIDSVIGYDYQSFIDKINKDTLTFVSLRKPLMLNGILVEIDLDSKQATSILRINETI